MSRARPEPARTKTLYASTNTLVEAAVPCLNIFSVSVEIQPKNFNDDYVYRGQHSWVDLDSPVALFE